ncbi:MAG: T9SS type A sorting domain-containing protein [Candidatus Delongbacteria bacterium]
MKKLSLLTLLTLAGASSSWAIYQFDVRIEDMGVIDCWNPATCAATEGSITIVNDNDEMDVRVIPATIIQGGIPEAYGFVCDADEQVDNCEGDDSFTITERRAHFEGPGFRYDLVRTQMIPYPCSIPFAARIIPTADDGCYEAPQILEWTWENYPEGLVEVTADFVVGAGETLFVEPGIQGNMGAGIKIIVQEGGDVDAQGTLEDGIVFNGQGWGGFDFEANSDATMRYVTVKNVASTDDGGAFNVASGAWVRIYDSIIAHNSTTGEGGAAYLQDGGIMSLNSCTVSDNMGATVGGVYVGGDFSQFECSMSILSFASPANTELVGTGFANVGFTNIYPQSTGFPEGMEVLSWNCDPGYVDAANFNYYPSFWSVDDPAVVNCIIDVSVNELENDPDGTPGDLGAIPFDQHEIMMPATILAVTDRPNDQGGFVLVEFLASPNDGSMLNPTTMYSVWIQYPGMSEDEWVSAGTVAAIANPEQHYFVQVPTLDDQFEGNENIHAFMIGTHSVHFPVPAASAVMTGFSLDNLAPPVLASTNVGTWEYDQFPAENDLITLSWSGSAANDFSHYVVLTSLSEDISTAEQYYQGPATSVVYSQPFGELQDGDHLYFWVSAVDEHANVGTPVLGGADYVGIADRLPRAYALSQNYPNPFNPSTTINFALPQAGQVKLSVYNMLGNVVATLVNGQKAAGNYSVKFDGSQLASGVYFYKLEAAGFSDLKKMILVK